MTCVCQRTSDHNRDRASRMMIKKMRGSQRNSLTMWKRQILVERRSPATAGFAFIDAHQTFADRSGNGGLSKASPEANWDSRRASDEPSGLVGCHFYSWARVSSIRQSNVCCRFQAKKKALHPLMLQGP